MSDPGKPPRPLVPRAAAYLCGFGAVVSKELGWQVVAWQFFVGACLMCLCAELAGRLDCQNQEKPADG
jgi:hypothetical protein